MKEINKSEVLSKIEKLITNKNLKKDFKSLLNSKDVIIEEYALQVAELNAEIEELKKRPKKGEKSQRTINREFRNKLVFEAIQVGNKNIDDIKIEVYQACRANGDKDVTLNAINQLFVDGKLDPNGTQVRAKNNVFKKQVLIDANGICSFKKEVETK